MRRTLLCNKGRWTGRWRGCLRSRGNLASGSLANGGGGYVCVCVGALDPMVPGSPPVARTAVLRAHVRAELWVFRGWVPAARLRGFMDLRSAAACRASAPTTGGGRCCLPLLGAMGPLGCARCQLAGDLRSLGCCPTRGHPSAARGIGGPGRFPGVSCFSGPRHLGKRRCRNRPPAAPTRLVCNPGVECASCYNSARLEPPKAHVTFEVANAESRQHDVLHLQLMRQCPAVEVWARVLRSRFPSLRPNILDHDAAFRCLPLGSPRPKSASGLLDPHNGRITEQILANAKAMRLANTAPKWQPLLCQ